MNTNIMQEVEVFNFIVELEKIFQISMPLLSCSKQCHTPGPAYCTSCPIQYLF